MQSDIVKYTGSDVQVRDSMEVFKKELAAYIHGLISSDFNKLVFILYRLDINEKKLKELLASQPGMDAGVLIGDMIIERQLQKIQLRKKYRQDNSNISEDEKW